MTRSGPAIEEYAREAAELDARIAGVIDRYALSTTEFDALACAIFAHQIRWNAPYAAYARMRGFDASHLPLHARDIPAVPAAAFKEAVLSTTVTNGTATYFETSGTTQGRGGKHYLESTALYERALLARFDRAFCIDADDPAREPHVPAMRYAMLVPDPRQRPHSSLGFMMQIVARDRGDGASGWYLHDDRLDLDAFLRDVQAAAEASAPVFLAATAFALVALLDELSARNIRCALPAGSTIMETGGFKGRSRTVGRDALYDETSMRFGVPREAIVAEYGMTELTSQYYDSHTSRRSARRIKTPPPWLRAIVVDAEGAEVACGIVGAIRHIDLANRSSVVAIETEDLGAQTADGGLILLGRETGAELRGCSLDAEDLVRR